jgi:hypothetical protein
MGVQSWLRLRQKGARQWLSRRKKIPYFIWPSDDNNPIHRKDLKTAWATAAARACSFGKQGQMQPTPSRRRPMSLAAI